MNAYVHTDKLSLLKRMLAYAEALEQLEPHFTLRREIAEIKEAIEELTP